MSNMGGELPFAAIRNGGAEALESGPSIPKQFLFLIFGAGIYNVVEMKVLILIN